MALLVEAFGELRPVRGYKLLDVMGAIMTEFDADYAEMQLRGNELLLSNQKADAVLQRFRVMPDLLWLAFRWPSTSQLVVDNTFTKIFRVTELTNVTHALQFGLRTQWVVPAESNAEATATVARFSVRSELLAFASQSVGSPVSPNDIDTSITWTTGDLRIRTTIRSSVKAPGIQKGPEFAVMLDVDVVRLGSREQPLEVPQFRRFLRDAERVTTQLQERFTLELEGQHAT